MRKQTGIVIESVKSVHVHSPDTTNRLKAMTEVLLILPWVTARFAAANLKVFCGERISITVFLLIHFGFKLQHLLVCCSLHMLLLLSRFLTFSFLRILQLLVQFAYNLGTEKLKSLILES